MSGEKKILPQHMHFSDRARMLGSVMQKLAFLYKPYALAIVSIGYVLAELGHFLIGNGALYISLRIQFTRTLVTISSIVHINQYRNYISLSEPDCFTCIVNFVIFQHL